MKRILVTGGNGAIGTQFIFNALSQNYEVINCDTKPQAFVEFEKYGEYSYAQCDIRDSNNLAELFKKHPFDYVVHFAAFCKPKFRRSSFVRS